MFHELDATNVMSDRAVMVSLVVTFVDGGAGFTQTSTYRQPDGKLETSTLRFSRR